MFCIPWSQARLPCNIRFNRHAKFVRAYPENDAKSAEQDDKKLAEDKVGKVSVIVLGTDQSHAHVRSIECARLCDHGIAIRRTRQRQQACEGRRRQGHSAGGSFTAAALIRKKGGSTFLGCTVSRCMLAACFMWHVTPSLCSSTRRTLRRRR